MEEFVLVMYIYMVNTHTPMFRYEVKILRYIDIADVE